MKSIKLALLKDTMNAFLENEDVCDGEDGYTSDTLHLEMAKAASAVYDASNNIEQWLKDNGHMT